ncbi:hypothetical protein OBE_03771, partial [human gut metagenome]
DPKCCWALRHPEFFPVEVNRADYEALLRVPGIGVVSAKRILVARRSGALRAEDLKKLGVVMKRAQYFLTCGGRYASPLKLSQGGHVAKPDGRGAPRAPTGRGTAAIPFRSGRLRRPLWHGARSSINTTAALKGSSAACLKATQKKKRPTAILRDGDDEPSLFEIRAVTTDRAHAQRIYRSLYKRSPEV